MSFRLFQNSSKGRFYAAHFARRFGPHSRFQDHLEDFHADLHDRCHTLAPVRSGCDQAFYTHGDDAVLQRLWAREKGMAQTTPLADILLAQIEEHRTEVFYNLDMDHYDGAFARRLPGSVKAVIGWLAAPTTARDLRGFVMVCNFPGFLRSWEAMGLRTAYMAPAHIPEMQAPPEADRPIDVLFIGTFSQYHARRAAVLEKVARQAGAWNVHYALARSRLNRLSETPLGWLGPLRRHRRPRSIRAIAHAPVYGRDQVCLLQSAKIVINGAIDMTATERGNMRCFETMSAGAALVSDAGTYPQGMQDGATLSLYQSPEAAVARIADLLQTPERRHEMAHAAQQLMRDTYGAQAQWAAFQEIAGRAA